MSQQITWYPAYNMNVSLVCDPDIASSYWIGVVILALILLLLLHKIIKCVAIHTGLVPLFIPGQFVQSGDFVLELSLQLNTSFSTLCVPIHTELYTPIFV